MSIANLEFKLLNTYMKFKDFLFMEQDPLGGGMGAPMGAPPADPMGGAGAPPADPMGGMGGPMGGMDPMGGGMGMDPMGGGEQKVQPVPTHADVWDVLDSILNHKQIKKVKPAQIPEPPAAGGGGGMGMDPMGGGMGGGPPMGGAPPMGGPPMGGGMGAPSGPEGGGGPFLQG